MSALDSDTFPVTDGIVYNLIHARHKHQREEHLKKSRTSEFQDKQARRKHLNSRRNEVSNELGIAL
jgi:hypothetical protein